MFKKFSIILLILVFCSGCMEVNKNSPEFYPFTKWKSTDQNIIIYMNDDKTGYGSIKVANKYVDVYFEFYNGIRVYCYNLSDYGHKGTIPCLENWTINCSKDRFVATVVDTTYFKIGKEIVFELVRDKHNQGTVL